MADSEPTGLRTLYADDYLLVLHKPSGLLSVPGRGEDKQDCLSARAQKVYPDALIVHRLDMSTSGLLLMARGIAMQRLLNAAFAGREVAKRYVAVVAGVLAAPERSTDGWAEIDLPISVDWPNRPLRKIDMEDGKPSRTRWRLLETLANATRLELEPVTGRSHQLRLHLAASGHAILGDALYAPVEVQQQSSRLLLHARSLALRHPHSGQALSFEDPAPF
ncbi:pseudouridine synthase [Rhodoferax sp.]|uniref:pseudouridine synthase n=1 Tax=Rhodoferax sp. TaxID=50421 RepID=UPI00374D38D0